MTRTTRIIVLLVALVAMVGVSVASASPVHAHNKAQSNNCGLCYSAHVKSQETPQIFALRAPVYSGRDNSPSLALSYEGFHAKLKSSRAPPAYL